MKKFKERFWWELEKIYEGINSNDYKKVLYMIISIIKDIHDSQIEDKK